MKKPGNGIHILYHASCADGFGAAYVAWRQFVLEEGREDVTFHAVQHGHPMPEIPDGCEVWILDFSYDLPTLLALEHRSASLVVIDHHTTSRDTLEPLSCATWDDRFSGAVLTWLEFYPGEDVPELLAYVQDRDLWRWEMEGSREFSMALRGLVEMDFDQWHSLATDPMLIKEMIISGAALTEYLNRECARRAKQAEMDCYQNVKVPIVNETQWPSETCEAMLAAYPDAPFAASFFVDQKGDFVYSLRSRPGSDVDVSQIAKHFGGGGHRHAAGFTAEMQVSFETA